MLRARELSSFCTSIQVISSSHNTSENCVVEAAAAAAQTHSQFCNLSSVNFIKMDIIFSSSKIPGVQWLLLQVFFSHSFYLALCVFVANLLMLNIHHYSSVYLLILICCRGGFWLADILHWFAPRRDVNQCSLKKKFTSTPKFCNMSSATFLHFSCHYTPRAGCMTTKKNLCLNNKSFKKNFFFYFSALHYDAKQ